MVSNVCAGCIFFLANIAFSALGSGAATRAGTVVLVLAFAYVGYRLARHADIVGD